MTATAERSRRAFLLVGLALPLFVLLLGTVAVAVWMPELPDPVATHWGFSGPDGFGPKWSILGVLWGAGGGCVLLFSAMVLWVSKSNSDRQPWSQTTRFLGATNLGLAAMITFAAVIITHAQRGLSDARDAPDVTGWVLLGFVLMFLCGVLGWFLQPAAPTFERDAIDAAQPLALAANERAVWMRTVSLSRTGWLILGLIHAVLLVVAAVLFAQGSLAPAWIIIAEVVLLGALTAMMLVFRVRASRDGLSVRSALGWPHVRIAASDIVRAHVVQVSPLGDFGGWGYRFAAGGRRGVVLRGGEALEVTQRNGKSFVVTVDDSTTAAAVLAAAADSASD